MDAERLKNSSLKEEPSSCISIFACVAVSRRGVKVAAIAEAHDLPISLHAANAVCLFSTSIHFAASVPNCDSVENHQVHRWLSDYAPVATMALQE
ncbi:MAG: enolase C-terminal domain-like protein, partial [Verrucomicrobiia bacterium]